MAAKAAPAVAALSWQERLLIEYCKARCHAAGTIAVPQSLTDSEVDGLDSHMCILPVPL